MMMMSTSHLNKGGLSRATLGPLCASTALPACLRASSSQWGQSSSSGSTGRRNPSICRGWITAPTTSLCSSCQICKACVLRVCNTTGTLMLFAASTARKKCSTRRVKLSPAFLVRTLFRIRPPSSSTSRRGLR